MYVTKLEKEASAGHVKAMHLLAIEYEKGRVVPQDYSKAFGWFTRAAELGFGNAQIDLGRMYNNGLGTEKDETKAKYWYEKASSNADPTTLHNLGLLYFKGQNVQRNYERAFDLFRRAYAAINLDDDTFRTEKRQSARFIAVMYSKGWGVSENKRYAREWYERAAHEGDAYAQYALGKMHLTGDGVEKSAGKGVLYLEKAAASNLPEGILELAKCYAEGVGVSKDLEKAGELFSQAANNGVASAKEFLDSQHSICSAGSEIDEPQARSCLLASGAGYPLAMSLVGAFYHSGKFVPKDYGKSVPLFRRAAKSGDIRALTMLGSIYATGEGVEPDLIESYAWTYMAAQQEPETDFEAQLIEIAKATLEAQNASMRSDERKKAIERAEILVQGVIH